jgi:hypothetical protein
MAVTVGVNATVLVRVIGFQGLEQRYMDDLPAQTEDGNTTENECDPRMSSTSNGVQQELS